MVRDAVDGFDLPVLGDVVDALEALAASYNTWRDVFGPLHRARDGLDHREREVVRWARMERESWDDIAEGLGLSRAGLQKRYARSDLAELDALEGLHHAQLQGFASELKMKAAQRVPKDAPSEAGLPRVRLSLLV